MPLSVLLHSTKWSTKNSYDLFIGVIFLGIIYSEVIYLSFNPDMSPDRCWYIFRRHRHRKFRRSVPVASGSWIAHLGRQTSESLHQDPRHPPGTPQRTDRRIHSSDTDSEPHPPPIPFQELSRTELCKTFTPIPFTQSADGSPQRLQDRQSPQHFCGTTWISDPTADSCGWR